MATKPVVTEQYTMVLDGMIQKYDIFTALVFGKIRRMEQRYKGACTASYQTMADELGISRSTVIKSVRILLKDQLIYDTSLNKSNKPGVTRKYKTNQEVLSSMLETLLKSSSVLETLPNDEGSIPEPQSSVFDEKSSVPEVYKDTKDTKEKKKEELIISLEPENEKEKGFLEYFGKRTFKNIEDKNIFTKLYSIDPDERRRILRTTFQDENKDYGIAIKRIREEL
jgi:DNA-binding Lrp family transcriptional regulator